MLIIRFTVDDTGEMCWQLVTWDKSVSVERPACLRQRLVEMCAALARQHLP